MSLKLYNLRDVAAVFNGIPLGGYGASGALKIEMDEPTFSKTVGVDGEVTRNVSNSRAGKVTITLMNTADTNDLLALAHLLDELTGVGVGVLLIHDMGGRWTLASDEAWIQGQPATTFGKETDSREWVIDCATMTLFQGGN